MPRAPRPFADPYLAGVALGLVLLTSFVWAGRGLGASGGFARAAAAVAAAAAPEATSRNAYFAGYLEPAAPIWRDWLVVELAGVFIGGALSARLARRQTLGVDRGARTAIAPRLLMAAGGGAVMGLGALLARGCTSGQALTGGALLSVGSWAFMLAAFAGAYALSPAIKRFWTAA